MSNATDFLAESKALRLVCKTMATSECANSGKARALVTGCGCKEGERFEGCEWHYGECVAKCFDKERFEVHKT